MGVYALHCTSCTTSYFKLSDWHEHLTNSSHQNSAKNELCQWDKSVRKRCVVIYSRTNLSKNIVNCVIPYLVENITHGTSLIVTDLILSADRPGIGIIRFENREKVNQLFSILKNSSIKIDNHLYQFRQLGKFLKLEWEELLVSSLNIELPNLVAQLENGQLTNCEDSRTNRNISTQVKSILKQVEIPDIEFKFLENVIKEVKQNLSVILEQECVVELYRNNYLKLRNSPKSYRYLIFMYMPNQNSPGFSPIDHKAKEQIFEIINSNNNNPNNKSVLQKLELKTDPKFKSKIVFGYPKLQIEFIFSNFPPTIASLQLTKLVTYYCHFDSRVKPLLSLVYFWAKLNRIELVKTKKRGRDVHSHEVDPVALEWLLLFFLFHKEQALPIPRKILERPHQPILVANIDLGFKKDLEFAQQWTKERKMEHSPLQSEEETDKNLVLLFTKFLAFCTERIKPGRHFINVRDGEFLTSENPSKPFLHVGPERYQIKTHKFGNYLSKAEQEYVSKLLKTDLSNMIVFTNPFDLRWRLTICYDNWFNVVRPAMLKTVQKLGVFLNNRDSSSIENVSLESVLACR